MKSSSSRYGLFVLSAVILALAAGVWRERSQNRVMRHSAMEQRQQERQQTQHAVALLVRAFTADNQLKYSALSTTEAMYGPQKMQTEARLTRTPQSLSILYLKGDNKGLHSGFNQKWFWRHKEGAPMEAYAAVQVEAPAMAARRFALMLENYRVQQMRNDKIGGRAVEIVEIRPLHSVDGSVGPGRVLGIDRETGLTLRTESFNYQWRPVMKSTLTQIDFSPEIKDGTFASPKAMFQAAQKKPWMAQEMGVDRNDVTRTTGVQPPQPKYTPPGFVFDGVGVHRCGDTSEAGIGVGALTRYTDGLNTLTIFAMPKMSAQSAKSMLGQACDFGPGTLMMRETPRGQLVAVADLPPQTLRKVLDRVDVKLATR